MQAMDIHLAAPCGAPSRRAPWYRWQNGLRHHAFCIVSLMIHMAVLSLATPFQRNPSPDIDQITITARLAPPGRAPTVEVPPIPPPPKTSPTPHRHSVTTRSVTPVPKMTFSLSRFIAARASAPVWGFWFPSCPAASAGNGPSGPPAVTASGSGSSNETGGSFTAPSYRKTPLPAYPAVAKARHWEGVALLHVEVLMDGRVHRVELLHSSGHRELDESALKAVQAWQFEPAKRGDVAVACFIQIPIRFKLDS